VISAFGNNTGIAGKRMALLFFLRLTVQRKVHLAFLPGTEAVRPDEDGHRAHAAQGVFEALRTGYTGDERVAIQKRRGAARAKHIADSITLSRSEPL